MIELIVGWWLLVGIALHVIYYLLVDDYRRTFYEDSRKLVRIGIHIACCVIAPGLLIGVIVDWARK